LDGWLVKGWAEGLSLRAVLFFQRSTFGPHQHFINTSTPQKNKTKNTHLQLYTGPLRAASASSTASGQGGPIQGGGDNISNISNMTIPTTDDINGLRDNYNNNNAIHANAVPTIPLATTRWPLRTVMMSPAFASTPQQPGLQQHQHHAAASWLVSEHEEAGAHARRSGGQAEPSSRLMMPMHAQRPGNNAALTTPDLATLLMLANACSADQEEGGRAGGGGAAAATTTQALQQMLAATLMRMMATTTTMIAPHHQPNGNVMVSNNALAMPSLPPTTATTMMAAAAPNLAAAANANTAAATPLPTLLPPGFAEERMFEQR
jgi:hypothetical protein